MTTPTINPVSSPGNTPDGPLPRNPVPHVHPFTAITGLRFGSDGRVEPVYDSADVLANGVVIALYNAAVPKAAFTPPTVPPVTISIAVQNNDGEADDNSRGKEQADKFLAEKRITPKEFAEITTDVKPTTAGVAPVVTSAGNTITVAGAEFTFDTVLTPGGTTLGTMIKNVSFPRTIQQLSQGSPGTTPAQIVNNLANLAHNIWEPLKRQYPQAFITNSFRQTTPDKVTKPQHGTGQAMDVQFRGVSSNNYFDIAVWISKNLPYNQLLLEYIPNKTVWLHVSYAIPGLPSGGISVPAGSKLATLNGASGGKFVPNLHADIIASAVPNRVVA